MIIKYKSLAKGVASNFFKRYRESPTGIMGTFSADGAYAIFMRYLIALGQVGKSFDDSVVVEFGPGSSFGMGICALLCGATRYYAYDLIDHTEDDRNLIIFDELHDYLKRQAPIPLNGWCARIFPLIDTPEFPHHLLPPALLQRSLDPARVKALRDDLASKGGVFFRPRSSSKLAGAELDEPADIIVSESVLEHVDDLSSTYDAFKRWIAPDGVMVHLIDYGSHKLSPEWNGHWQCSPAMWKLVRGKRYYLINRASHQTHLDMLRANGFDVVQSQLFRRIDGVLREDFSPELRGMNPRDATTALAAVTCLPALEVKAERAA